MMRIAAFAAVGCLVLRTGLYFWNPAVAMELRYLYTFTPARCDGLFMGSWIALWLRGTKLRRQQLHKTAYALIVPSLAALAIRAATIGRGWKLDEINPVLCTYGYTLVDLAAAGVLLLALDEESGLSRVLRNRALAGLGVISYGFYFFHGIPLYYWTAFRNAHQNTHFIGSSTVALSFLSTLLVAWLSYRFYESPILLLKERLAPSHRSVPSGREQPIKEMLT